MQFSVFVFSTLPFSPTFTKFHNGAPTVRGVNCFHEFPSLPLPPWSMVSAGLSLFLSFLSSLFLSFFLSFLFFLFFFFYFPEILSHSLTLTFSSFFYSFYPPFLFSLCAARLLLFNFLNAADVVTTPFPNFATCAFDVAIDFTYVDAHPFSIALRSHSPLPKKGTRINRRRK